MIVLFLIYLVLSLSPVANGQAYEDSLAAEFGNNKITLKEFKKAYINILKQPNVYDSKDLREGFLNELITERVMADQARIIGLDTMEVYKIKLAAYHDKCLREAHFRHVVKPKVDITDPEIEDTYRYTKEQRRVSHLFFKTKTEADSFYNLLSQGANFEDLAKIAFSDTALANNGGDLGWVDWEQMEYDFAKTAFHLNVDEYSQPIRTTYGYHIIKVTDVRKALLISQFEFDSHKRKTREMLEYKIGDKLGYEYIDQMLKKSKTTIYPKVVEFIHKKIREKFRRKPNQFDQFSEMQLLEGEIKHLEQSLWDGRNDVFATINGKNYTVGQFMEELNYIPYLAVYSDFKSAMDFAVRDFLLTDEAKTLGLENDPDVQLETQMYGNFVLQLELRRHIIKNVKVSEEEVSDFYEKHKDRFNNAPLTTMHPYLEYLLRDSKQRWIIPESTDGLLKGITVKKNMALINYYLDVILKGKR